MDACRAGPDDTDTLVFHVDTFGRPEGGVADVAFIVVYSWPIGEVTLRCKAKARQEETGGDAHSILALDAPLVDRRIPAGRNDVVFVQGVLADAENFVDMLEVSLELLLSWILQSVSDLAFSETIEIDSDSHCSLHFHVL